MSRTLRSAHADLYALVNGTITNLSAFDHEPRPGDNFRGRAVTVSWAGMDPTDWQYAIRIYVDLGVDARKAQFDLMDYTNAVEAQLATTAEFTAAGWSVDVHEDLDALVATCIVSCGREDYF